MASEETSYKILLFPFLGHGHISPYVELAKQLSNQNFLVYLCSTPDYLKTYAKKLDDYQISQVEFHLPSYPDLPSDYNTITNALPPHLASLRVEAMQNSGPTFSKILESVQPDVVIYDIHRAWLPPLAASYGIPSVYFQTMCATIACHALHSIKYPDIEYPFQAIFLREYEIKALQNQPWAKDKNSKDIEKQFWSSLEQSNDIILIKSSRVFDEKYIDFQSKLADKKMITLGSLVSEPENLLNEDSKIIRWLNEKDAASTVYVSFGSEIYLTKEEVREIALALEISNVNFIWVVRSPYGQKMRLEEVMPEGFLDRIKGKGFVEDVWAPQTQILKHPSIGAFVSHCGWGSLCESITLGVPIVAMPVQHDQPLNARFVVELGVGLEVVGDENGNWKGEEIARIIDEVMLKDGGEAIRKKSRELYKKVRDKAEEEIVVAFEELRNICEKWKKNRV